MGHQSLGLVVRHLRRLAGESRVPELSDIQLLERFVAERHEEAFAALMQRHGAMVFGVCRRVLGQVQDAEDAFQATFLALARQARSVGKRGAVGGWLYRVAYRIAMKAKASSIQRRSSERHAATKANSPRSPESAWQELRRVLDEELDRLPQKHRLPVVLCYLEGMTYAEAAWALGWPRGTVSGRLALARDLLRQRLARRGLVLSAGLLATLLSAGATGAAVPADLLARTGQSALLLTAGQALAGVASARVVALLKAATPTIAIGPVRIGLVLAFLFGVLATGTGLVAYPQDSNDGPGSTSAPVQSPMLHPEQRIAQATARPRTDSVRPRAKSPEPLQAPFTPQQAKAAQQAWAKYLGNKVEEEIDLGSEVKMVFVLIPPGTFKMGSPKEDLKLTGNDKAFENETPQHQVTITKPFYLGKYVVTRGEYQKLTGKEGFTLLLDAPGLDRSRVPVESVTRADAEECSKALEKKLSTGWRKARLPSEAMWEYACRAGTETRWHVGNRLTPADARFGHGRGNLVTAVMVGYGKVNAFGLYEMHGNVTQWCSDYWSAKYPAGAQTDPEGPATGSAFVVRGGGWYFPARRCRSAFRKPLGPGGRDWCVGLRLALVPTDPDR